MLKIWFLFYLVLLLRFSGTQSNGMVSTDTLGGVDALVVNSADNPTELLELVRKMSLELNRLANEQRKKNAVIEELQETQKMLISSQSELQNRIKDLEVEAKHFEIKDRMRRSAPSNVGFTARLTNHITNGHNTHRILVFDNVYINVGNGYDATTGLFHAPVAGMYVILMTLSSAEPYPSADVEVVHNGEVLCRAVAPFSTWGGCPCNSVVRLKVGDAVWVREIYNRPNVFVRGDYYTTFSMGLMIKDDDGVSSS